MFQSIDDRNFHHVRNASFERFDLYVWLRKQIPEI
jgi:hypothetical protein